VKITKKVREDAAWLCALSASNGGGHLYWYLAELFDISGKSVRLAVSAWSVAPAPDGRWCSEVDAEAEAMLLSGWEP
jgi:hypothetical protein